MRSSLAIFCVWICFSVDASTPNASCSEIPEEENAEVSQSSSKDNYTNGDKLDYNCKHGYASLLKITYKCVDNKWTKIRDGKCSLKRCELPEDIPNGRYIIVQGSNFVFGTTIKYICIDDYQMMSRFDTRTCREAGWDNQLPACEEALCGLENTEDNIRVEGLPDYDGLIRYGHRLTFSCSDDRWILQGPKEITCRSNGQWSSPFPKCVEVKCVANLTGRMRSDATEDERMGTEISVRPGRTITLNCLGKKVKLQGPNKITCQPNGNWSSPFPKCETKTKDEVKCVLNLTEKMRSDATEDEHTGTEISVKPARTITLTCDGDGVKLQGRNKIICQSNGEWNIPWGFQFPKCIEEKCGPPPNVEFADTTEIPKKKYNTGETIEYVCFDKYILAQSRPYSKLLTCDNGEWTGNIRCLKPCSVTVEEMDKRGIELRWRGREKIFSPHEDRITFKCKSGKTSTGIALVQTCNDGVMNLPLCE